LKIAIIGAGIAGLTLATLLNQNQPDIDVVHFEKSRGVGGRMATRYTATHSFDHGAQFFTLRTNSFRDFLG
jgi:predicted NAD/FAD-dependent oxidoreductase